MCASVKEELARIEANNPLALHVFTIEGIASRLMSEEMDQSLPKQEVIENRPVAVVKPRASNDLVGRVIGMLVFLLGIGLLIVVFQSAHTLFTRPPDAALGLKFTGNPKTDPPVADIGSRFGYLFFQVACLFVMSIAGSLVAQKGVNLYFSALRSGSNSEVKSS
jgi:hypothetical protein